MPLIYVVKLTLMNISCVFYKLVFSMNGTYWVKKNGDFQNGVFTVLARKKHPCSYINSDKKLPNIYFEWSLIS